MQINYAYFNFHTISSPKKQANYKANVEMDIYEANELIKHIPHNPLRESQ